ncbi:metallophosphoesterase [Clostridium oryzae]|uniref:3',5'-cyclic adenosine monophosphate phosphodiesterase CpdA n=1 Tax=Clostridium oryzae TaxID=1450648 RepID=A0A1V4IPF7_9CLOT|nr:metallophosphoesterase [Clostridium oryzae]OPJ61685.1 3',5'-cyclic adenosine monophosphate phosphodiesterase CpdA [Clostridium oryzae]
MRKQKFFVTLLITFIFIFNITVNGYAATLNVCDQYVSTDDKPVLLITEVVPYSTNDKYEFVEVYNNSDKDINLKDYRLNYRYPYDGRSSDIPWTTDKTDIVIKAGNVMVFWIINSKNASKTVADFNNNYSTNLVEGSNIVKIYGTGLANTGYRGVAITTNTGVDIDSAVYHKKNIAMNKGIMYKCPVSGTVQSIMGGGKKAATPGQVLPSQIPYGSVYIGEDNVPPVIEYSSQTESIDSTKDYDMTVKISDDNQVKSAFLYYKFNATDDYQKVNLVLDKDNLYTYKFITPDLLGKKSIQYYFVAGDGTNEVKSDVYESSIVGSNQYLWLNVKDDQYVSKSMELKASSNSYEAFATDMYVDGKQQFDIYDALEDKAYFSFEVNRTTSEYKNGVVMNDKVIKALNSKISNYTTITVPVSSSELKIGEDNTISIRAGSRLGIFDDDDDNNKDDFYIRNVRLTLPNGYQIRPEQSEYNDPSKIIAVGDDTKLKASVQVNFRFNIDKSIVYTRACKIDTRKMSDGTHAVEAYLNNNTVTKKIIVDNTPPAVEPLINTKKDYKGKIKIDFNVYDGGAGIDNYSVKFDNNPITLPYKTSSSLLTSGRHNICVIAKDKVGNSIKKNYSINVVNENPYPPKKVDSAEGKNGDVSIRVKDPTNDRMKVSFYKAYKYSAASMAAFQGEADIEPPKEKAISGESQLNNEQLQQINAVDGNYVETDSASKFPYQRFDISIDNDAEKNSIVEINWQGKSLMGRLVTLYAWNMKTSRWKPLASSVAADTDFKLSASVRLRNYLDNGKIHVLVQDKIYHNEKLNNDNNKFSFVWMSDTQYYSQYKPKVYDSITNWIAQNKEAENIKYCIHTGDIVNNYDNINQWENASKSMSILDNAAVPYGILAGNHDVGDSKADYSNYDKYFGSDKFNGKDYYGGSYKNNKGHYDLISAGNNDFVILYMGWGIGDKEITWMNKVLNKYQNRKAILCFHEYMLEDGKRSLIGDKIFNKVVVPNKNVITVLCGHNSNTLCNVDGIDDNNDGNIDRNVYQILCDYQSGQGGDGFITLLQFDTENNKINLKSYSPYLNKYNFYDPAKYPEKDSISLDVNLQSENRLVATDSIEANVYTKNMITSFKNVKSGSIVKTNIKSASSNAVYYYVVAEDKYGGRSQSEIFKE